MAFPQTPLDMRVRIAPGADPSGNPAYWSWVDILDDVRVEDGVDITVGRADEGKQVDAAKCSLSLNNQGGHYSTRNPLGRWYGLLSKNTPLDVGIYRSMSDPLIRTVATTWGNAPDGDAWVSARTDVAGSASVSAAGGKHVVTKVNTYWYTYLPGVNAADVDVYATGAVDQVAAGGDLEPLNLMVRVTDLQTYYLFRVRITSTNAVAAVIFDRAGKSLGTYTLPGVTYTAGLRLRARAQAVGGDLRMKLWVAGQPEPAAWAIEAFDDEYVAGGGVGIRSGISGTNTSPKPVTFTYTDFAATMWVERFFGEIPELPPRWDKSGKDSWVPIEASGLIRRLSQGAAPLRSPMSRSAAALNPAAHWSLEEDAASTTFAETLGRSPMVWANTPPARGTGGPPGSAPLIKLAADTSIAGTVEPYTSPDNSWGVQLVVKLPDEQGQDVPILDIYVGGGTYRMWRLWFGYNYGPGIYWRTHDQFGAVSGDIMPSNIAGIFPDGKFSGHDILLACNVAQKGANMEISVGVASPDDPVLTIPSGNWRTAGPVTVAGTNGPVTKVAVPNMTGYPHTDWIYGQILVTRQASNPIARQMFGYAGEKVSDRINRLCGEEGVPVVVYYGGESEMMGPQGIDTFLNLLRDCEKADSGGILYENGGGFGYMPRVARYNRLASMILDFTKGQIAEPPEPTDDDQGLRNDITCKRPNGSTGRYIDTTSNNRVSKVGRYDEEVTINVYSDTVLSQHAAWRVHLGTVDEMRWPRIDINLAAYASAVLIPPWLGAGIGSRIWLFNPPGEVAPDTLDLCVEGYSEHIGVAEWSATLNCSPASAWHAFVLDTDKLDADPSSALAADITSSATSMLVTMDNATWTTDPAEWTAPRAVHVGVGGERMQVTKIAGAAADAFSRTAANGWGNADTGQPWTISGDTVAGYTVDQGVGKHSHSAVNSLRRSTLDIGSADWDYTIDVTPRIAAATGAPVLAWVCGRYFDDSNHYVAQLALGTTGRMSLGLQKRVNGVLSGVGPTIDVGTNTAGDYWRVRFQGYGKRIRAKAWNVTAGRGEPGGWLTEVIDTSITSGTRIGLLSRLEGGNTNTPPVIFQWDNLNIISPQEFTVTRSVNTIVKPHSAGEHVGLWNPAVLAL